MITVVCAMLNILRWNKGIKYQDGVVCCRFWQDSPIYIYVFIYIDLFTIYKFSTYSSLHPQISMIQLVAQSQTMSKKADVQRERWKRSSVSFKEEATDTGSQWVFKVNLTNKDMKKC